MEMKMISHLVPGSLVWAQQRGYPWWPALIEIDPDTNTWCKLIGKQPYRLYHVTYLGDPVNVSWRPSNKVKPYSDMTERYVLSTATMECKKALKEAIAMAAKVQETPPERRIEKFGWNAQLVPMSIGDFEFEGLDAMDIPLDNRNNAQTRKKMSEETSLYDSTEEMQSNRMRYQDTLNTLKKQFSFR